MIDATKCENCGKRVLCGCASKDTPRPDLLETVAWAKRVLGGCECSRIFDIDRPCCYCTLTVAIAAEEEYRAAVKELMILVGEPEPIAGRLAKIDFVLARLRKLGV